MANTTERIGVSYCSLIAAKTEWMFREQPIDDIGIDAHMERTDTDGKVQQLPIQCKVALTIKEAAEYSNIGINKLESLLRSPRCPFVLYVGKKKLVKRKEFEKFISDNVEI